MKAFLKYFLIIATVSFSASGCEKDNLTPDKDPLKPDKNALRISKIADNSAMLEPLWDFEYDSDGRLIGITGDENRGTTTITYNAEDLPELATWVIDDFGSTTDASEYYDTSRIVWGSNSFILDGVSFSLDENGNATSIIWDDGKRGYEPIWQEDRVDVYFYWELDSGKEWEVTRVFNEYNSPLSAINLAIINACDIDWIYDDCYYLLQNNYCLTTFNSQGEGRSDFDYEYNDDGYPIKLMETMDGEMVQKLYFEYESN